MEETDSPESEAIDRYLLFKGTAEERAAFEARLEAEPELREQVRFQRVVVGLIREGRRDELKQSLAERIAEERASHVPIYRMPMVQLMAAMLLLGALGFTLWEYTYLPTLFEKKEMTQNDAAAPAPMEAPPITADTQMAFASDSANGGKLAILEKEPLLAEVSNEEMSGAMPVQEGETESIRVTPSSPSVSTKSKTLSLPDVGDAPIKEVLLLDTVLTVEAFAAKESYGNAAESDKQASAPSSLRIFFLERAGQPAGYKFTGGEVRLYNIRPSELSAIFNKEGVVYLQVAQRGYTALNENTTVQPFSFQAEPGKAATPKK